jgi:hypothetical protein
MNNKTRQEILKELNLILNEDLFGERDPQKIANNIRSSAIEMVVYSKNNQTGRESVGAFEDTNRYANEEGKTWFKFYYLDATGYTDNITEIELKRYIKAGAPDQIANSIICNKCKGIVKLDGSVENADAIYYVSCKNSKPSDLNYIGVARTGSTNNSLLLAYKMSISNSDTSSEQPANAVSKVTFSKGDVVNDTDGKIYAVVRKYNENFYLVINKDKNFFKIDTNNLKLVKQ